MNSEHRQAAPSRGTHRLREIDHARLLLTLVALFVSVSVWACGPRPWPLAPPSAFSADFLLHQRLLFRAGDMEASFQAALQRRGGELTLVALTPMGTRAFVIVQREGAEELEFTSSLPEDQQLPIPPEQILADIQRALLPLGPAGGEDDRVVHHGGQRIQESWRGGRLRSRRFAEVLVTYGGEGLSFGEEPGEIRIEASRYTLEISTLAYQRL